MIHGRAPGTTVHLAWAVSFAAAALGVLVVATIQVVRFPSAFHHSKPGASAAQPAAEIPARAVLKAEIDRRWPEINAWGEALEREFRELQVEERALETLRYRIGSRRRQYHESFPPDAHADDQLDVLDYNHRMTVWRTRIGDYNTRLVEYRKAAADFDQLVQQYDSGGP